MIRHRMRGWAMAAVGVLALVLAGCGASTTTASSIAPGLNTKEVTLLGGIQVEPNFWFPITSVSTCSTENYGVSSLMYEPLLYVNKHDVINFNRSIASGITVSDHDRVYTVTLNPKWRWSNGRPVTAQDVVYAWDIIDAASQPTAPWTYCLVGSGGVPNDWQSVVAKNPYTVVITTTQPVNPVWFELNGIAQIIPIPKSVWDVHHNMTKELNYINTIGNSPTNPAFKVIDGPYGFGTFVDNEYWTMVANPHYVGHKATIKTLLFEYDTSSSNVFANLRKGVFATAGIPSSYYADRGQLPKYYQQEVAPYSFCFNYMVPNLSPQAPGHINRIFDQLYVRQALQLGIDQPAIIKDFYDGLAVPTYSPVPSQPRTVFYDPNVPKYPFNPAEGKALLLKHGWKLVNGVMTKNGQPLAFQFLVASGSNTDNHIAELIKADWAAEGIDATIKEEPFNQVIAATLSQFQLEWWGGGWCYGAEYPSGGALFGSGSSSNSGDYSSQQMNKLIAETHAPQTPAQALKSLDAYQAYAAEQLPVLYLPTATNMQVVKDGLHGVNSDYNPLSGYMAYNRWYIGK